MLALALAAAAGAAELELELLGEASIPAGTAFEDTVVGGLSGITYDAERDRYYAVADDPSSRSPARFYTLAIDLADGSLEPGDVTIEAVTLLTDRSGRPFPRLVMDAEGITLTPRRTLIISAEGNVLRRVPPSIREFDLEGRELRRFKIPRKFRPSHPQSSRLRGVRHNNAFESLTWAAGDGGGGTFYTAVEQALFQDGPAATIEHGSPARILRYAYPSGKVTAEYVYPVDPVVEPAPTADGFRTNGLVELLAMGDGELLALERSYTQDAGYSIRLFQVATANASDVSKRRRLDGRRPAELEPVEKRLLLDLGELGLQLDNLEGMTFGPVLLDGRRTLVLVSDDNFDKEQRTQGLAFAMAPGPLTTDP